MNGLTLLNYAAPPLIGAFIGYLTNRIAIRMLFRPLRPWHVLGWRVPMTPGVIPAKRHELAANIGTMVGEHLLTARDIGAALSMEPFQEHLFTLVDSRVRELLDQDLGPALTLVPERFRAYAKVGLRTLKYQLKDGLRAHLHSDAFARNLHRVIEHQISEFADRPLEELLSGDDRQRVYRLLDRLLAALFQSSDLERWLTSTIEARLVDSADRGATLADLLPDELVALILTLVREQAPQMLTGLAGLLNEPAIQDRVIEGLLGAVDSFLSGLGPMAAMARGFINPDTLAGQIRSYLHDHRDEITRWLLQDEIRDKVASGLEDQVRSLLRMKLADLLARFPQEQRHAFCASLAGQLMDVLRNPATREALSRSLADSLEEMVDQGRIPLGAAAGRFFADGDAARLRERVVRELLVLLRSRSVSRLVGRLVDTMVDSLAVRPVGILARLMPAGVRRGITEYIVLVTNRMLLKEVPGLVRSLNISTLVREKVDSLDLLQLEGLLLSIMEEQFKYINLFGALLGFLIGLINLALLVLP